MATPSTVQTTTKLELTTPYFSEECVWGVVGITVALVALFIGFMIYWHVKKYDELVNQKQKADAFLADEEKRRHESIIIMQQDTNHV